MKVESQMSILLLNAECVQAVAMAKSLRKCGCRVIGFCNHRMSSGYATRWLSERHKTPDIVLYPVEFKCTLYNYLKTHHVDAIIPLADDSAVFLSTNKVEIEKMGILCAIPDLTTFSMASNKQSLMELCAVYGFPHPKTRKIVLDNLKSAACHVGFPAMIKPNMSQGAKGIVKVENMDELQSMFPDIHAMFGACTLQQYIEQPGYYYNVMLYRTKQGKVIGSTIIKIRRFFPLKGGSSCYCETIEYSSLLKVCEEVLDRLGWYGFADFDVLEDKHTGELKIIELNPRVPSSIQAAFAAGIDFAKLFVADLFDSPIPEFHYTPGKQVRWMGLDVMWFLFSTERFGFEPSWFKFLGKDVSYHDGTWNDPLPMLAGMLAGIMKYLNPEFRKSKLGK